MLRGSGTTDATKWLQGLRYLAREPNIAFHLIICWKKIEQKPLIEYLYPVS